MEAGKGGRWGPESSVGATKGGFPVLGSLKLAGDEGGGMGGGKGGDGGFCAPKPKRVGGWGEAWGGGLWRAGKGWEQQKVHIWLVTRVGGWGRRGEVAHGGRARGGDGVGAPESISWTVPQKPTTGLIWLVTCGSNKRCTGSLQNLTFGW